jgi:hypothetical protein
MRCKLVLGGNASGSGDEIMAACFLVELGRFFVLPDALEEEWFVTAPWPPGSPP